MLVLEKGIDFEINKDDGSVKMVEKMDPDNYMLSEPNISYKPFWGICRPLNSWRANSPNPIQIYCAHFDMSFTRLFRFNQAVATIVTFVANGNLICFIICINEEIVS